MSYAFGPLLALSRRAPVSWHHDAKILRVRLWELLGSSRFSKPGLAGLDLLLEDILRELPVKTFLEIGANDGYNRSKPRRSCSRVAS